MTRVRKKSRGAVERTLASFVDALEHAFYAEELARKDGLLQNSTLGSRLWPSCR